MKHIKDIPAKELVPGILGRYIHGSNQTVGYVEIKEGSLLPVHTHMHEQITFIVEGSLKMQIGNDEQVLTKGCFYVIPSNIPHSAYAVTDCIVIDVFNPIREDYK